MDLPARRWTVVADTGSRVSEDTPSDAELRIADDLRRRIVSFAHRLDDIERRLEHLDREWDVERTLEAKAGSAILAGVVLGTFADRRWFALSAVAAAFLVQYAVQGWCPVLPLLRRLGVRTAGEIARERYALKALRGDFDALAAGRDRPPMERAIAALRAVGGAA
ncbi:MAG: DUF2892 domain-containing protein [Rhodospirillaceae bacterium]|nr:DUF2892 domain-containing protein [Rhodospirillaceae bacterium]